MSFIPLNRCSGRFTPVNRWTGYKFVIGVGYGVLIPGGEFRDF